MSIPELLIADIFKTGSAAQVSELVGGTTINAIGGACNANTAEGAVAVNEGNVTNRVAEYRGEIYVVYQTGPTSLNIDGYNRGTGLWTNRHTASVSEHTGLFVANTGTGQRLFLAGRSSTLTNTVFAYTDDGIWTTSAGFGSAVPPGTYNENSSIMFNNKCYTAFFAGGGLIYENNPVALAHSFIGPGLWGGGSSDAQADFCVHDDRLFVLATDDNPNTVTADWALYEFTGSGFVLNTQITSDSRGGGTISEGRCNLFNDPTTNKLIALCNGAGSGGVSGTTNNGATAFELTPSGSVFTVVEITSSPSVGTAASATLTNATNFLNTETVTIDGKAYQFQTTLTDSDGNVQIGASVALSHENLRRAINLDGVAGTNYATSMTLHPTVSATDTATTTVVTAKVLGVIGNTISLAETAATGSWSPASNLTGGTGDGVIPVAFRPGARATAAAMEDHFYSVTVNDTAPGSPEAYIFFTQGPSPGTGYSVYTWTDASTLLVSPAAGPSVVFTIPQEKFGGGLRINRGTGNQIVPEFTTATLTGLEFSYRVEGTIAAQTVRGYYSEDQETPTTQMSISSQTGGGGIGGGNSVTGVTGDDGTTLFTFVWDFVTDGVANADACHFMLDIR